LTVIPVLQADAFRDFSFLETLEMKNFLKSGLLVAVAVMSLASSSNAGVLGFSGTTGTHTTPAFSNVAWTMALTYTANAGGPVAAITAGSLTIGGEIFALDLTPLAPNTLTVASVTGLKNDTLAINAYFEASTPGGFGTAVALLSPFTVTGTDIVGAAVATDTNIQNLGATIGNTFTGQFLAVLPGVPVTLNGSVPAPEPGSIAVLCGLGLIVGRRVLKSRSSKKQEVAA